MGLENPNFVEDLVETNPVGLLDVRSEGDDHFRGVKRALKQTFPGFVGRIWRRKNVTASGPLVKNDNSSLVRATQAITLTPDAASVLGEWMCFVRADGGQVTINPAQNINGAGSATVPVGYTGILFCDGTEFFMSLVYSTVPASVKAFPSGTTMSFHNTTAPIDWTKLTSGIYDNAAIRTTTGAVASGGTDGFTGVFAAGRSANGHTLSTSQIPAHPHGISVASGSNGGAGFIEQTSDGADGTINSNNAGGGASHAHGLPTFAVKYVDFILATMN